MTQNKFKRIFSPYFDWLTEFFGHLAHEASKHNVSAGDIARDFLNNTSRRQRFHDHSMPTICATIDKFWSENSKIVNSELNKLTGFRARFGGDIGPQTEAAIFAKIGLYFDTIIVPDPLLRVATLPGDVIRTKDYYLLKYGITQVLTKDYYLADIDPAIAVLVADQELVKPEKDFSELEDMAKIDCVALVNALYMTNFDGFDEVEEFFSQFQNGEEAAREIQKPEIFLLDEDVPLNSIKQYEASLERTRIDLNFQNYPVKIDSAQFLLLKLKGRMMQINDIYRRSLVNNAHLLIGAPVSFHWLAWKVRSDQKMLSNQLEIESTLELELTNSLLSQNLEWLSNVPASALIELRKKGQLSELRELINKETSRYKNASLTDIAEITKQIDYNLSTALKNHQEEKMKLDKTFRSELAISGTTFLLSVASAIVPSILATVPLWLSGIVGTTSLKSVIQKTAEYLRERKKLSQTPMGILWQARSDEKKETVEPD